MRWKPIYAIMKEGQRPITAEEQKVWGRRVRYMNTCQRCLQWMPRKNLEADHIIPCGSLVDIETDAGPFILRLLVEREGLRRVCKPCHQRITNGEIV